MSGNQKQPSGLVPQSHPRYSQGPTDGFHVTTQSTFGAQQPPNQGNNQGPNLRNMVPTGPPTTASTPPNTDLKVPQMPQSASVNLGSFIPQTAQVRATGQTFYNRAPPPQNQTSRMPNRQGQQHLFTPQVQYVHMQHVYPNTAFSFNPRPTTNYVQPYQSIPQTFSHYPPAQTPQQLYAFTYPTQIVPRPAPPPQVASAPQNHTQPNPSTMVPVNNTQQYGGGVQTKKIRRAKALAIIDPNTGEDIFKDFYDQDQDKSHPESGESSARQTPQPSSKEIQPSTKQVVQAINDDENTTAVVNQHQPPSVEPTDHHHPYHQPHPAALHHQPVVTPAPQQQPPPKQIHLHPQQPTTDHVVNVNAAVAFQQQLPPHLHQHPHSPPSASVIQGINVSHQQSIQNNGRVDHIAINSSLTPHAKEFVSLSAKEVTPVVSALTDSEEVTISKQPIKDRESPTKNRKQQTQRSEQQKEQPAPPKDAFICEKPPASANIMREDPKVAELTKNQHDNDKRKKEKSLTCSETTDVASNVSSASSLPSETMSAQTNAKSRNNTSHKSKDAQKQPNTQQLTGGGGGSFSLPANNNVTPKSLHVTTPLPVPQTQPSKATNKTNKMKEINQKGLLKEGSDMDAFSDENVPSNIPVNNVALENGSVSKVATAPTETDNASNRGVNDLPPPINNSVIIENSKIANEKRDVSLPNINSVNVATPSIPAPPFVSTPSAPPTTMAPPTVFPSKPPRVDVTSIVPKMTPAPLPIFKSAAPAGDAAVTSHDETDRASLASNDKLIQAKNKANRIASVPFDHRNIIETKNHMTSNIKQLKIPEGKKVYSLEDLYSLRQNPASKQKPVDHFKIPHELIAEGDERMRMGEISRYQIGGRSTTDFAPDFGGGGGVYTGRGSSQRGGPPVKRGSQSGKLSNNNKGSKQSVIKVSISVKEDVKLHETENAWKPARFTVSENMSEDEKKTNTLYRKVRGILNKLTPQKFNTLLNQIESLEIDTCARLQGVIDLVFEKAVDEPNFSVAYAALCRKLALKQVPNSEDNSDFVNFRKLLVTRCQREFEKNSADECKRNAMLKDIDECADPEKKKEMQLELEEYDRRLRMKSVGNIRFIGELYKQQMLTVNIMHRCIVILLEDKKEESLECLCKLLSTIGQELEDKGVDLKPFFITMKEIVDRKHGKISSRVRFMLQDVIDLRNAKWVPRRQDLKPKTIEQIQQEADSEHLASQALNSLPMSKRDDRGLTVNNSEKKRRNKTTDDGGWSMTGSSRNSSFNISSDKLKNKTPLFNEPLGTPSTFNMWSKGSGISGKGTGISSSSNIYAALDTLNDSEKRGQRQHKDAYFSKPSLERINKLDDGRGSRSSSQHRSRDSSVTSQRSTGGGRGGSGMTTMSSQMPPLTKGQSAPPPQTTSAVAETQPEVELTSEQLQRRLKNILDEYLNELLSISEFEDEIKRINKIPASDFVDFVRDSYNNVLERTTKAQNRSGQLFAHLIKRGLLTKENYFKGLEEVFSLVEDLAIDIPKVWDYLPEIIVPLLTEEAITFKELHKSSEFLINQKHTQKFLALLFKLIVKEKREAFLQSRWRESGLKLEQFLPNTDINKFVIDNNLEFLLESSDSVPDYNPIFTFDELREKLLSFFNSNASNDDVTKWIEANVGKAVQENHFIKALMTAILEHSIMNNRLKDEVFKSHYCYLHRYVGASERTELQCLFAVQALLNKMEYPQGLLLAIFEKLYEENLIPHETFISWEENNDPSEQAGKGVALKQLTSFFTNLKEADDETESSASEEA